MISENKQKWKHAVCIFDNGCWVCLSLSPPLSVLDIWLEQKDVGGRTEFFTCVLPPCEMFTLCVSGEGAIWFSPQTPNVWTSSPHPRSLRWTCLKAKFLPSESDSSVLIFNQWTHAYLRTSTLRWTYRKWHKKGTIHQLFPWKGQHVILNICQVMHCLLIVFFSLTFSLLPAQALIEMCTVCVQADLWSSFYLTGGMHSTLCVLMQPQPDITLPDITHMKIWKMLVECMLAEPKTP